MEVNERQRVEQAQQVAEVRAQDLRRDLLTNKNTLAQAQASLANRRDKFKIIINDLAKIDLNHSEKGLQQIKTKQLYGLLTDRKNKLLAAQQELKEVKNQARELLQKYVLQQNKIGVLKQKGQKLDGLIRLHADVRQTNELTEAAVIRKQLKEQESFEVEPVLDSAQSKTVVVEDATASLPIAKFLVDQPTILKEINLINLHGDGKGEQNRQNFEQSHNNANESYNSSDAASWHEHLKKQFDIQQLQMQVNDQNTEVNFVWQQGAGKLGVEIKDAGAGQVAVQISNVEKITRAELFSIERRLKQVLGEAGVRVSNISVSI